MLQNNSPCSIASSRATCVCLFFPNQCLGKFLLVVDLKSVPSFAIAKLLISRAEKENELSPAKAIMYQYINVTSHPAGYPTHTARILATFPTWIFSIHLTYSGITSSVERVSFRQASQASF